MVADQDWIEAYKELCTLIKNPAGTLTEIEHVDLWYEQVDHEKEEYPFPPQCLFIDFAMENTKTLGLKVQDMDTEITFYHVFDTLSDSWEGSDNQATALAFGNTCRKLHKLLQGISGVHFSQLDRRRVFRYPTRGGYLIVYAQSYKTIIRDYAAFDETNQVQIGGVNLQDGITPPPPPAIGLFETDL